MILVDTLLTLFSVQGVASAVNSYTRVQKAQESLRLAYVKQEFAGSSSMAQQAAATGVLQARMSLFLAQMGDARTSIMNAVGATAALVAGLKEATTAFEDFGNEIANIKALTGATLKEATEAATLFRVAGIQETQAFREILRVGKSAFDPQALAALGQLGVSIVPGESGVQFITRIARALREYPEGLRKTALMEKAFGRRNAETWIPLMRMTDEELQQVNELADTFDTRGVEAARRFEVATNRLGQTMLQKVIYPLVQALLPSMLKLVNYVATSVTWWGRLNDKMRGFPAFVLVMTAVVTSFGLWLTAIIKVAAALETLIATLKIAAFWEVIVGLAAKNPELAFMLLMAGVVVGGVYGLGGFDRFGSGKSKDAKSSPEQKFSDSVDKFSDTIMRMEDSFGLIKGAGGLPSGMGNLDPAALARAHALGAIG